MTESGGSSFARRIRERCQELSTVVCLGIDPRPEGHPLTHPERFEGDPAKTARAVVHYFQAIIDATAELVACYKLQSAFFERLGIPGLITMAQLLADLRGKGIPVILDAKRGDIGSTAQAYSDAYLKEGVFAADAMTVNPYLGLDTLEPFLADAAEHGRGVFVLLKTSNPGSGDVQDVKLESGERLWEHLGTTLNGLGRKYPAKDGEQILGAVVGATYPEELKVARELLPGNLLLIPGYGAQGGTASELVAAFRDGGPAVVSASRSLTYVSTADDFAQGARQATVQMRDALNEAIHRS